MRNPPDVEKNCKQQECSNVQDAALESMPDVVIQRSREKNHLDFLNLHRYPRQDRSENIRIPRQTPNVGTSRVTASGKVIAHPLVHPVTHRIRAVFHAAAKAWYSSYLRTPEILI